MERLGPIDRTPDKNQVYLIRFGHTKAQLFKKKVTRNGHFSRPAETDPYVNQGDELCATGERLKESESDLESCQQGCAEKEKELEKRNSRIEHLSSEISRMNRFLTTIKDIYLYKDM